MAPQTRSSTVVKSISDEMTCSICLLMMLDPYKIEPCGHSYCNECISRWLLKTQHCPLCRETPKKFLQNRDIVMKIKDVVPKLTSDAKIKFGVTRHQNMSYCFLTNKITLQKVKHLVDFQIASQGNADEDFDPNWLDRLEYETYVAGRYNTRVRRQSTLRPCLACRRCDRPYSDL